MSGNYAKRLPMLILRSAFWEVCKNCGRHGHIVFSSGILSKECYFKEEAYEVIQEHAHVLSNEEIMFLDDSICRSDMPWLRDEEQEDNIPLLVAIPRASVVVSPGNSYIH